MLRLVVTLALVGGCRSAEPSRHQMPEQARAALEQGSAFELLTLDPAPVMVDDERVWTGPTFQGSQLLGRRPITGPATRGRLVSTLERAAADWAELSMACFDPRHAIHVIVDGQPVDFLICFECGEVEAYVGDATRASDELSFPITGAPDVFNATAVMVGLPLSPD